jgi:hypothetical protein
VKSYEELKLFSGGLGVVGSNPAAPTNLIEAAVSRDAYGQASFQRASLS